MTQCKGPFDCVLNDSNRLSLNLPNLIKHSAMPAPDATESQRRDEDGLAAFDEQLRQNPDNIELVRGKASASLAIGHNDRALASYDAILDAHPLSVHSMILEPADSLT
jgi:hypothetical protein